MLLWQFPSRYYTGTCEKFLGNQNQKMFLFLLQKSLGIHAQVFFYHNMWFPWIFWRSFKFCFFWGFLLIKFLTCVTVNSYATLKTVQRSLIPLSQFLLMMTIHETIIYTIRYWHWYNSPIWFLQFPLFSLIHCSVYSAARNSTSIS